MVGESLSLGQRGGPDLGAQPVDDEGRLARPNDRRATLLWIVEACESEERVAAARLSPRSPWWRRLTGGGGR